ncbi:uncharacterized protein LOC107858488 [Capsicum annuum]|uniref:uncharacterized protein LOC107858488 n=1 Tax=Capsicum annuum TaxID=4072 RepID=UPI001FB0D3C0|nr:uncharacterized protein LOC107858488 [Capsicum annuum]
MRVLSGLLYVCSFGVKLFSPEIIGLQMEINKSAIIIKKKQIIEKQQMQFRYRRYCDRFKDNIEKLYMVLHGSRSYFWNSQLINNEIKKLVGKDKKYMERIHFLSKDEQL